MVNGEVKDTFSQLNPIFKIICLVLQYAVFSFSFKTTGSQTLTNISDAMVWLKKAYIEPF